ncbi:hypothetical protein [Umezawaea beigongshangensis]|uniref:hypothetical protein n=1 Tax=Umezawaea beigongshangensis TaxID=2780383 RepID=UPI0018F12BB0|nr:hypothetical protein [Umezawaea beigongshangensis]
MRDVVERYHPAETQLLDDLLHEFRADPERLLAAKPLRAPARTGVQPELVVPHVLAAASFLDALAVDGTAGTALDAVRDRVSRGWAARRMRRGVPTAVCGAGGAAGTPEVVAVVRAHLENRGVDAATARRVAEQVVGELLPAARVVRTTDPVRGTSSAGHPVSPDRVGTAGPSADG